MRIFIAVIFAMAATGYIELPGLVNKKQTKELWAFIILLIIALLLALASLIGVKFYVITDLFIKFFGSFTS